MLNSSSETRQITGADSSIFAHYLTAWALTPDGNPLRTRSGHLLPVRHRGSAAMLKVAVKAKERFGGRLMKWWEGQGAARVLAHDGEAILLERAEGSSSLIEFACSGRDDEASRIICRVVAKLHTPRNKPPPELVPLSQWFSELETGANTHGGILRRSADTARALLAEPQDIRVLHGDIHHDNILDFGSRGWLVIDPKGLLGERGFDYANLFCNPNAGVALAPGRLELQVCVVSAAAGLAPQRLLQWILAWAGLSAVWFLFDGEDPKLQLAIAELAAAKLDR